MFSECLGSSFEDVISFPFSIGAVATSVGCAISSEFVANAVDTRRRWGRRIDVL